MTNKEKRRFYCGALALLMSITLNGCGKKADCTIEESHAHLYSNEDWEKYIVSEYEQRDNLNRTEQFIIINPEEEEILKLMESKKLYKINDNLEHINEIVANQVDFIEYRYFYITLIPMITNNNTTYISTINYAWTTNPNRETLTGETRTVHYVYQAYKIEKNEEGHLVLVSSEWVDSLDEIKEEYPFIKKDFFKTIYLEDLDLTYGETQENQTRTRRK